MAWCRRHFAASFDMPLRLYATFQLRFLISADAFAAPPSPPAFTRHTLLIFATPDISRRR